jgi:hypothetical protein
VHDIPSFSTTSSLPGTLSLSTFLLISATSDHAEIKLCLVQFIRDHSPATYSMAKFNFLPSVEFVQSYILFGINWLSAKWELSYVCVDGAGPLTFVIYDMH